MNLIYPFGHLASNIFNDNNFIANICIIFHSDRIIANVLTVLILVLIVSVSYKLPHLIKTKIFDLLTFIIFIGTYLLILVSFTLND